jgi:ribosomal protein L16/L10AE
MATRRLKHRYNSKTRKVGGKHLKNDKKTKTGKKWTTAIEAAQKTLITTKNLEAAKTSLRKQALYNARKLFGSI